MLFNIINNWSFLLDDLSRSLLGVYLFDLAATTRITDGAHRTHVSATSRSLTNFASSASVTVASLDLSSSFFLNANLCSAIVLSIDSFNLLNLA